MACSWTSKKPDPGPERFRVRRRLRALLWVVCVALFAACAAPARPGEPAPGSGNGATAPAAERAAPKRLTAAIRGYPKSVSLAIDAAGAGSTAGIPFVEQMLNDGFAVLDDQDQLRPRLAETVPTIENGLWKLLPDGRMETTWRIRDRAVWQDGAPVTAEDVVFTAEVARDKQLAILQEAAFDAIESVEAVDPRTVLVRWHKPYIWADGLLSTAGTSTILPMPRHLLQDAYQNDRASFTQLRYWGPEFVGTGPFKLREYVVDSHLVVAANDLYVHGRPKIDEIEVRFIGDFSVMVANILAGAVEMTLGRGLSLEQGIEASSRWREGRMEHAFTTINALFPQFINPSPPVVADLAFRRALFHAMDRQQMSDLLQAGVSPVAHNPLLPNSAEARAVEPSVVRYEHDPQRAVQLIGGLGYTRGPDGLFRDATGGPLSVKIQTTQDDLREKLLPVIGDHWRQAGVALEPVIISRQASSDRQLRSEFASFDFTRQPADLTRYHGTQVPLPENNYRGSNRTRYRSAELDALIDRYLVTVPRDERNRVLSQMVQHMTENVVIMGLFFIAEPALITNRLVNVSSIKSGEAMHTWNVHEWDLR
jgi:peptide/nickel transport system substrate-binding protein